MNYKDKIKMFMELKEERLIEKLNNYVPGTYYNKEIGDLIEKRTENQLRTTYRKLIKNIMKHKKLGLGSNTCPFCIMHNSLCNKCRYGEINGKCYQEGKDSLSNIRKLFYFDMSKENMYKVFSNEFYTNVFYKIKNKEAE